MTINSGSGSRLAKWFGFFLIATFMGLYSFTTYSTSALAEWETPQFKYIFAQEMSAIYTALALFPAVLWFMNRFPIERRNWARRLPLHLAVTVAFGVSHTLMMWGSRTLLYQIIGWGTYDYGRMGFRFLMEYQKQSIIYWFIYAVITLIAYTKKHREQELQASQLERQLSEARLNALQMQLNPHFLFNTLNMISSYVYEDARKADKMISTLSDLLRLTLRHADRQEITLEKELEFLDAYLAIMKERFQERLQVTMEVDPAAREYLVPHLILQPLVENSIKHTTGDFTRAGSIRLAGSVVGETLRLVLEDNGPGMTHDLKSAAQGGVGLSNTIQRLEQLYGKRHLLEIVNIPSGGLRITMELPARKSEGAQP